jgi:hypothetical protein
MSTKRECGACQLCCRLLPTEEINKPANQRCPKQKHGVGCSIYAERPMSCALWNCRWLVDQTTGELPRPDRAHYVIDMMPDYVIATEPGSEPVNVPVIQVWVDPAYPDAHRAPSFRRWLDGQRMPAVIRYGSREGFTLLPPCLTGGRGWIEHESKVTRGETTLAEKAEALGGMLEMDLDVDGMQKATLRVGNKAIEVGARVRHEVVHVETAEQAFEVLRQLGHKP